MEQYVHLLIARPDDFAPTARQIAEFCQLLIERGAVPNAKSPSVSTPSGKFHTVTNPFTGEVVTLPQYAHQRLKEVSELGAAADALGEYCLHVEGAGRPETPPLKIDFEDPYSIAVRCHVTPVPHGTSSVYDDFAGTATVVPYDRPCPEPVPIGCFTDPTTNQTVEVPEAGRARFWIEFELGKWLFPSVKNGNLEVLNPAIVAWAESEFGIQFAQGCHYF